MIKIDYPLYEFRMKKEEEREFIFDEIRKTWLRLTPEEWVRQNFVQYLLQVKKYPSSLLALEKRIQVGEMSKRFDILIYDAGHHPWMMIECKSMEVVLREDALRQALRYNMAIPVPYLVITNGIYCMAFHKNDNGLESIAELPEF
ncbi:MAG: type I restriction enzyme HsdR N-terminal domain-containing protein [Flavitalea sp.]